MPAHQDRVSNCGVVLEIIFAFVATAAVLLIISTFFTPLFFLLYS